ncbi:MAG TPA: hypothetical protein VHB25_16350 [Gemmatimonadaceae bacterium]|nr:hypothetical protein [Gemmatimonadaceae bacterium]
MKAIIGIVGMAIIFGVYSLLRPRESTCSGHCAGCTGDGACESDGAKR